MKQIIGIMLLIVVLTGCGSNINGHVVQSDKIKVGVIAPLTGQLAEYGIAFVNGLNLAREGLGAEALGFEFIIEDSAYDPKLAVSAFRKLTSVDKVDLVMDWGAATSEAIAPISDEVDVPFIAFSYDDTVPIVSSNAIRAWNPTTKFGKVIVDHISSEKIGIVKTELTYLNKMLEGLEKVSDADVIVIDNYNFGDNDFRTSLLKIRKENISVVGVFLASGQISQFYKQAKELGIELVTFGTDFFESQSEIDASNGLIDGVVFPNMKVSDEFRETYRLKYGDVSQITFAGNAYDMTHIVVREINYNSTASVLSSLKEVKEFSGVLGEYNYAEDDGDRYLSQPVYLRRIENGVVVS